MKRFLIFMITLCLVVTTVLSGFRLPVYATLTSETTEEAAAREGSEDAAAQEDAAAVSGDTSADSEAAEGSSDSAAPQSTDPNALDSSPENPIGDNSSYYNVSDLGSGPDISAESAVLMDATTGAILYGKEADTKRYPASITKVMTALLVIENCQMNDIVTFSNEAVNGIEAGSSSAGINVGAQLTVEDTLNAMMLVSANEAAAALAEHVAGSIDAFAEMMTQRAAELGCTGTHFTNPHGLPDENHYTTAHDMALILRQAMKYPEFRKVAETISYTLEESDTLTSTLELWNHAKILRENSEYYYEYAKGSKTGFTQAALNTLVTYAQRDNVELLCIILKDYGADSSYNDTAALFDWGFGKVTGVNPLANASFDSLISSASDLDNDKKEACRSLKTSFNNDYYVLLPQDFDTASLSSSFTLEEDTGAQRLGYVNILAGENVIGRTPVTYEGSTAAADPTKAADENIDDLETAPNSDPSLKPHKLLEYILRVILAIILIVIIMWFIRRKVNQENRNDRSSNRGSRSSQNNQSSHRSGEGSGSGSSSHTSHSENGGNVRRRRSKNSSNHSTEANGRSSSHGHTTENSGSSRRRRSENTRTRRSDSSLRQPRQNKHNRNRKG